MKLYIDNADIEAIRRIYAIYPVDGVTTNPSILAAAGRPPYDVLKEIRNFIGDDTDLFVQAVSPDADGMVREAEKIVSVLGKQTIVKISSVPAGFTAMKRLRDKGIRFIGTCVYTPMQGFLAAKCGAEYAAVYVNRVDNMGFDGIGVAGMTHDMIAAGGYTQSGVLGASFKNCQQVLSLIEMGVKGVTVPPAVMDAFVKNAAIDAAVGQFRKDFEALTAPGRTMENC